MIRLFVTFRLHQEGQGYDEQPTSASMLVWDPTMSQEEVARRLDVLQQHVQATVADAVNAETARARGVV